MGCALSYVLLGEGRVPFCIMTAQTCGTIVCDALGLGHFAMGIVTSQTVEGSLTFQKTRALAQTVEMVIDFKPF